MVADHKSIEKKLNIAKGQIDGIKRMIENDAYCVDISNQLLSTITLLKHTYNDILSSHIRHCVKNAKDEKELDEKMKEIDSLLEKMSR